MFSSHLESEFNRSLLREINALDGLGRRLHRIADATGGAEARRNHGYRNRTHNLERSTGAYLVEDTPNGVTIRLEPLAEYAPFVAARGYLSMTRAGRLAEAAIERAIGNL